MLVLGCFNKQTWPFDSGKPFTEETMQKLLKEIGDVLELTVYDAKLNETQECFDKCIKTALYYFNLKTTEFESRIRDMIEVEI